MLRIERYCAWIPGSRAGGETEKLAIRETYKLGGQKLYNLTNVRKHN